MGGHKIKDGGCHLSKQKCHGRTGSIVALGVPVVCLVFTHTLPFVSPFSQKREKKKKKRRANMCDASVMYPANAQSSCVCTIVYICTVRLVCMGWFSSFFLHLERDASIHLSGFF